MEKVILFGCGNYAKQKISSIRKQYEIIGCIDNAVKPGLASEFEGIVVKNTTEIDTFASDSKIVLLSFKWFEMFQQLDKANVDSNRILFGALFTPYLDEVEKLLNENNVKIVPIKSAIKIQTNNNEVNCYTKSEFDKCIREEIIQTSASCKALTNLPLQPISRRFGAEFGTPIDRIYIERFIRINSEFIKGTVMEIAEDKYSQKYEPQIDQLQILHVNGWGKDVIKGNFETGEGIVANSVDCLICTQTLLMIYDLDNSIKNIYALLKEGGTALITVPGITQISMYDYRNWGQYWSFTEMSFRRLLEKYFLPSDIDIKIYGNVKTAIGFLYGICAEEYSERDIDYTDNQYQVLIGARVTKKDCASDVGKVRKEELWKK